MVNRNMTILITSIIPGMVEGNNASIESVGLHAHDFYFQRTC